MLAICSIVLAAGETAITASSRVFLHQLHKEGNKKAGQVLDLQQSIGQLISAILLLNTWILTSLTALVTALMTHMFGSVGAVYAAFILSIFIAIYLEVAPKVYVYRHPEEMAIRLAAFLSMLRWVLFPVTSVVDRVAYFSLKFLGFGSAASSRHFMSTTQELRGAIDLHRGGSSTDHERAMLQGILDLAQLSVDQVMVHRKKMFALDIDQSPSKIIKKVFTMPYTRIPLWHKRPENIVGVLHAKDICGKINTTHSCIADIMDIQELVISPWFVPRTTTLFKQLQAFRERREHLAFVVDESGALLGMITLEDILEEIVGEISDEHDVDIPGVRLNVDGSFLVQGSVSVRDLNRQYQWNLPESAATTLAGLLIHGIKRIPQQGEVFDLHRMRIEVLRCHRYHITLMKVCPLES